MAEPKRLTVEVDEDLHRRAKVEAARRGVPMSVIVRDALRAFVGEKSKRKPKGEPMDEEKK